MYLPAQENYDDGDGFVDRSEAGKMLALELNQYKYQNNALVLALPKGGVLVAREVAHRLSVPLDVLVVRKLNHPISPEFGIGAISEAGVVVFDPDKVSLTNLSPRDIVEILEKGEEELSQKIYQYRQGKPLPEMKDKTVIIIDDGLATGVTAKAVVMAVNKHQPKRLIYASPVCADENARKLEADCDRVVCLLRPRNMIAVGNYYEYFNQISDEEVKNVLGR